MNRLTLGSVKPWLASTLNFCVDDPRLTDHINAACERLLYEMKSTGTWIKYRVCLNNGCIVWPRQIETIEAVAVCDNPIPIRNQFFEFLETGFGIIKSTDCGGKLVDQGEVCSFDNIAGTGKKLAIYSDQTESTTEKMILQYYDKDGQWVRTEEPAASGTWIDGEAFTLPVAGNYVYSSNEVLPNGLVRVIKPKTKGVIRLYEYDVATTDLKPLAYYEPSETVPVYRSSLIPSLSLAGCCGVQDGCDKRSVTVIGKLRFIPAEVDNDFLPIGHKEAIRLGCQGVAKERKDLFAEAMNYWYGAIDPVSGTRIGGAVGLLKKQLEHYIGHGVSQPIKVVNTATFGGGGIPELV